MGDDRYFAEILRDERDRLEKDICNLIVVFESNTKFRVTSVSLMRSIEQTRANEFKLSPVGDKLFSVMTKVEL